MVANAINIIFKAEVVFPSDFFYAAEGAGRIPTHELWQLSPWEKKKNRILRLKGDSTLYEMTG